MTTAAGPPGRLGHEVARVEDARSRLVDDLQRLDGEVRLEVAYRMEKMAWKTLAGLTGALAAFVVTKLLNTAWNRFRPDPPPMNPADPETGWGEAFAWTAATGVGIGIARMVAQRGAALGWKRATGRVAPAFEKDGQGY